MKNNVQLRQEYPEAWIEVMSNPISLLWDNMDNDRKEEVLKGITENREIKNEIVQTWSSE